jgi:hypothetical protein
MNLRFPLLLLAVLPLSVHAIFNLSGIPGLSFLFGIISNLLSPIWGTLVNNTCQTYSGVFGAFAKCGCTGSVDSTGLGGVAACELTNPICILPQLCGNAKAGIYFNLLRGIQKATACVDVSSGAGIPGIPLPSLPEICLEAVPSSTNLLKFASCDVKFGNAKCQKCTVCASGTSFTADCSNLNLVAGIKGPIFTQCIGFNST